MMSWAEDEEDEEVEQSRNNKDEEEPDTKLKYSNLRATQIPTCQRLQEPRQGTVEREIIMESTKEKLLACVQSYMGSHCDRKGNIKTGNLTQEEVEGLKKIKKDIKDNKVVVFTTDKSGKFTVDTPDNYNIAVQQHSGKDEEVEEEGMVKQIENRINQHMRIFNKIFKVGSNHIMKKE